LFSAQEPLEFPFLRILPIQTVAAAHLFPTRARICDRFSDQTAPERWSGWRVKSAVGSRAERAFFDSPTSKKLAHVTSSKEM